MADVARVACQFNFTPVILWQREELARCSFGLSNISFEDCPTNERREVENFTPLLIRTNANWKVTRSSLILRSAVLLRTNIMQNHQNSSIQILDKSSKFALKCIITLTIQSKN